MDATAVSVARGLGLSMVQLKHVLLVAAFFGGSQALMPLLGWVMGATLGSAAAAWGHWIAFTVLSGIGIKMLLEARSEKTAEAPPQREEERFAFKVMLLLALATSVDALAVGFTLPLLDAPFVLSLCTIGVTTAVLSVAGLFIGRRFGSALGPRLDIAGGLVLIGLGIKILGEHWLGS
jgi:putative Mn2+ efflux pump MntP